LRILWLSHLIPFPPKGGVLQRSYNLIKELSKYHEVDLLAFHQPSLFAPIYTSQQAGIDLATQELQKHCNYIEFFDTPSLANKFTKYFTAVKSLFSKDPYNINWMKSAHYGAKIQSLVSNNNYDAVHFDTISLIPYLPLIGDIPCVLDHHNIESHMLIRRAGKEKNFFKKFYYWQEGKRLEKYEKIYCEKFSFNITCSDLDSDRLKHISKNARVETIPNGVDIHYFQPHDVSHGATSKKIIFIGRLNFYPNAEAVKFIARSIWPIVKTSIPNIECDLIGANPPQEVVELAKTDPHFAVHGFVDDILPYMERTTIYVCPIKDGGGTKLKVLDALAMGMPLVAHPIACEGIEVTNNHTVLFAETPQQFADKIKQLFDDPKFAENISENERKLIVEKYSYESIGKKLSGVFEKAINAH